LNQGKQLSDKFEIGGIDRREFELRVGSLSDLDKARVLYNHVWYTDLDESFVDELYKDKRYQKIINHRSFNPRLISFITDSKRLGGVTPAGYWTHIEGALSNPRGIWRNMF